MYFFGCGTGVSTNSVQWPQYETKTPIGGGKSQKVNHRIIYSSDSFKLAESLINEASDCVYINQVLRMNQTPFCVAGRHFVKTVWNVHNAVSTNRHLLYKN